MHKLSNILLSPAKAERHSIEVVLVAFFYTSLSLLLSLWIFPDNASLVMVFFTVIACLYLVQGALIIEESKEMNAVDESWLLKQHAGKLWFFFLLFVGFMLAFLFWSLVLPSSLVNNAFAVQNVAYNNIRTITGSATSFQDFILILTNNARVLLLSLLFALFYGAGAIFILAWNASIMGFVIGSITRNSLGLLTLPQSILKYSIHGIPEMMSYIVGALAGGILFIAVIRGDFRSGRSKRLLLDSLILVIGAFVLLVVAALLEVHVSPHI